MVGFRSYLSNYHDCSGLFAAAVTLSVRIVFMCEKYKEIKDAFIVLETS
jgi:hypothetical protein